jgi:hypothetical protein
MKLAVVVVAALTSVASADTATPAKPEAPIDENADATAREANLESNAPREGLVLGASLGFGIMMGGGVGRGPAVDFRLGHVATQRTVITFELAISSSLHKEATMNKTLTDSVAGLFIGAQRYTAPRGSVWIRGAGGLSFYQADFGKTDPPKPITGVGGLVGGGIDLARWGKVVLGFEAYSIASLSRDGFKLDLNFSTGLSFY